jgi:hypothetical protein
MLLHRIKEEGKKRPPKNFRRPLSILIVLRYVFFIFITRSLNNRRDSRRNTSVPLHILVESLVNSLVSLNNVHVSRDELSSTIKFVLQA